MFTALIAAFYVIVAIVDGGAPFTPTHMVQPVPGAARGLQPDGFNYGKLCNVTADPFNAKGDNQTDDTFAIQSAINACGDLPGDGGTVLLPKGFSFVSGSLWLQSNMSFVVEEGATLIGSTRWAAYNMTYTRSSCIMTEAHAALLNAGRCLQMKSPLVGWDDCAKWATVSNLVISGGGTINGNGDQWWEQCLPTCPDGTDTSQRPTLFGLLWVDGLTIRNMKIRHPAFWTMHPTFSNNVRIVGNDIYAIGHGTDGLDPDSCWNVYIANNTFFTRDDCIALKAGKDWSGRMVNISTENVLVETNVFTQGHGVAIGSETSGWIRDVVIRDLTLSNIEAVVRMKSTRGRGGGIERVLYERIRGNVIGQAIQINLNYKKSKPTNASATPIVRDVTVRDIDVFSNGSAILCDGLSDSIISNLSISNVTISGNNLAQSCDYCQGHQNVTTPKLCINP